MGLLSSLFKKKEAKPDGHVWIGLDFGTATTECVIRVESKGEPDKVWVLAFGGSSRADAAVVLPSAMEVCEERVVPAYLMKGLGHVEELLKTRLIEEIDGGMRDDALRRERGPFGWAMLHLASVLAVARAAVSKQTHGRNLRYYLNIAAPVGADPTNMRDAVIREVFRELGYRALTLSASWPDEAPTNAEAGILHKHGTALNVPAVEESPVFALPEALAAVTSFLHAPHRKPGNYATIDVGGGTTDISVFWFKTGQHDSSLERAALYYSVRSTAVGTNDLIAGLKKPQSSSTGVTVHERLRHMVHPQRHIFEDRLQSFKGKIQDAYRQVFRDCWDLRPVHRDWCVGRRAGWTLLLLGGGSSFEFVKQHLEATPPVNMNVSEHGAVEMLEAPPHLDIVLPSGEVLGGDDVDEWDTGRDALRDNGALLTVAYGLAFRAPDIPKYRMDSAAPPPSPPPPWVPPPHTEHN